jgi:hypothetical protein
VQENYNVRLGNADEKAISIGLSVIVVESKIYRRKKGRSENKNQKKKTMNKKNKIGEKNAFYQSKHVKSGGDVLSLIKSSIEIDGIFQRNSPVSNLNSG